MNPKQRAANLARFAANAQSRRVALGFGDPRTSRRVLFEQDVIDHIKPAEEAVDDRPQHRMVVGVGDRDGKRRAKADAVFGAFDAVIDDLSVHETLLSLYRASHYRPENACADDIR